MAATRTRVVRSEDDKHVQEWIEGGQMDLLADFLTEHPELLEHEFIIEYTIDQGSGYPIRYMPVNLTLLQYAVKKEQVEIIKMLLQKGANPNNGGSRIMPPIFWAVTHEPTFIALVEGGASLKLQNAFRENLQKWLKGFDTDDISSVVKALITTGKSPVKLKERNNYAFVEPNEANIFGEEMEDGTTVAYLDPVFHGQRLVAKRANGSEPNTWKKVLQSRKNPWTRQNFDPSKVVLQKVVVGPSVNMNGGKRGRKTLRKRHQSRKCRH